MEESLQSVKNANNTAILSFFSREDEGTRITLQEKLVSLSVTLIGLDELVNNERSDEIQHSGLSSFWNVNFNLTSAYFVANCHQLQNIIPKLKMSITAGNFSNSQFAIRTYFLLIEIFLRGQHRNEKLSNSEFQSRMIMLMSNIDEHLAVLSSNLNESGSEEKSPMTKAIGKNIITLITYRIQLYRCRIALALGKIFSAKEEVERALDMFVASLLPMVGLESLEKDTFLVDSSLKQYIGRSSTMLKDGELGTCDVESDQLSIALSRQYSFGLNLKAHVEYLLGNISSSLDILRNSTLVSSYPTNIVNEVCSSGQPIGQLSGVELTRRLSESEQYNNLACIYMKEQKYELAGIYFQRAIDTERNIFLVDQERGKSEKASSRSGQGADAEEESGSSKSEQQSRIIRRSHFIELHYNQGMAHMKCSRPLEAFQCFQSVLPMLHRMPYIWIRLAECCINFDQMSKVVKNKYSDLGGFYETVLSGTRSQRILLRCHDNFPDITTQPSSSSLSEGDSCNSKSMNANNTSSDQSDISSRCNLLKAVTYLQNALMLLDVPKSQSTEQLSSSSSSSHATHTTSSSHSSLFPSSKGAKLEVQGNGNFERSTGDSTFETSKEDVRDTAANESSYSTKLHLSMEEAVHLKLTFVNLCLSNFHSAIKHAKEVIKLSHASGHAQNWYLAITYSAEALCAVGEVNEAEELLRTLDRSRIHEHQCALLLGCKLPRAWCQWYNGIRDTDDIVAVGDHSDNGNNQDLKSFERLISLVNSSVTLTLLGKMDEAYSILSPIVASHRNFIPALQGFMYILLRQGRLQEAMDLIQYRQSTTGIEHFS